MASQVAIIGAGMGGLVSACLLAARDHAHIRQTLGLDAHSRVLLLGSEGDTDPVIYKQVVGRDAAQVLAA